MTKFIRFLDIAILNINNNVQFGNLDIFRFQKTQTESESSKKPKNLCFIINNLEIFYILNKMFINLLIKLYSKLSL